MGVISISGLRLTGRHGVLDQERIVGNEFEINIELVVPISERAMLTDSIDDTVNYAEVVQIAKHEMSVPSKLIEAVAGRIKNAIIARYGAVVEAGSITISKLAPPIPAQLKCVSYTCKWKKP